MTGISTMPLVESNPESSGTVAPLAGPGIAASAVNLTKSYRTATGRVTALDGITLHLRRGELTAVMGPPGAGKSTLLRVLSGLSAASSGSVHLAGIDLSGLDKEHRLRVCRDCAGFVSAGDGMAPTLTVAENIALATAATGQNIDKEWFDLTVDTMDLREILDRYPTQLPVGLGPRVALARAVLVRPQVIFADDPISGMDPHSVVSTLDALRRAVDVLRQTIVMVVTEPVAAAYCDRAYFLADGRVADETPAPTAHHVLDRMRRLGMQRQQ